MSFSNRIAMGLALTGLAATATPSAEAGGRPFRRNPRPVVEAVATTRPENRLAPSPMLGTFRATPYITVSRASYSPLDFSGRESSLLVYGPLSAFRATAAPVNVVVRGYDGVPAVVEGTSFSYPNLPALSPVVYPTRASNYSALRYQRTSPQRDSGFLWIDEN